MPELRKSNSQEECNSDEHPPSMMRASVGSLGLFGVTPYDSDPDIEIILERLDPYIVALVHHVAYGGLNLSQPEVLNLDIDEIVQEVRIKFWKALQEKDIPYPTDLALRN